MKTAKEDIRICIARIYYPVEVLGPGKRVGIWTLGCDRGCRGCISPELREYDERREVRPEDVALMLDRIPGKIDGFTVSGGEPFYRPASLAALLRVLTRYSDDIIVFTGYTLEELLSMEDPYVSEALADISVLIDGPFEAEKNDCQGLRGSANQRIHIFRNASRYEGLETCTTELQPVAYGSSLLTIGIPHPHKTEQ